MPDARTGNTIAVRATLFADLRRLLPKGHHGTYTFALPEGATVADLIAATGIPDEERVTVSLNGDQSGREATLHDGDEVLLFSPMEGG